MDACVIRGQYEGYKEEVNNENSSVETFVSIKLQSADPKWHGVPIILSTGKALNEKRSEIKITYRKDAENESNELVLRLQPNAGIEFGVWTKEPGYEQTLSREALSFSFQDHFKELPEAYEQVLYNAIHGDHSLFTSGNEVLETWRILEVVQQAWKQSATDLRIYKKGSRVEEVI